MIKIENTDVWGFKHAIRGMRNPLNSWDKSDSDFSFLSPDGTPVIGENDKNLMKCLFNAGTDHRKFMRQIMVSFDVTAGHTWWAEFDTYKVGTVRNSCSKMHKIHAKEFVKDDFDHDGIDECGLKTQTLLMHITDTLNILRTEFNQTKEKKYWRAMIELLPMGYHLKATVSLNYEVLANIYHGRQNHKLAEWHEFCDWIKTLPCSELITGE